MRMKLAIESRGCKYRFYVHNGRPIVRFQRRDPQFPLCLGDFQDRDTMKPDRIWSIGGTRRWMIASAIVFGAGFGTAYPVYVGYVMRDVSAARRGAAFGAILAAFDTGIGTGSTSMGWIIQHYGFRQAFGVAAAISALALPYFLSVDRMLRKRV